MTVLEAVVADDEAAGRGLLAELKADPDQIGLETAVLGVIDNLAAVRQLGLLDGLFIEAAEKLVVAGRARTMRSYPSDLRGSPGRRIGDLATDPFDTGREVDGPLGASTRTCSSCEAR